MRRRRLWYVVVVVLFVALLPVVWLRQHTALPSVVGRHMIQRSDQESHQTPLSAYSLIKQDDFCSALLPVAQEGVGTNLTVHVVVLNRGVVRLFENLLCSLERILGEPARVAVLAMDSDTCPFLSRLSMFANSVCLPYTERMMKQLQVFEPQSYEQALEAGSLRHSETFGTVNHKVLINSKLYATRDVLDCGFACFTTDTDVVFFQDILAYFDSMIERQPSLTMMFQKDQNEKNYLLDINSGFFIIMNTEMNLRFFTDCITKGTWWHIDQSRVNQVLASGNYTHNDSWSLLPTDAFPVGSQVLEYERKNKTYNSSVVVAGHANWSSNLGRKFHMLRTVGWWFTNFSSHQCLAAGDPPAVFEIRDFWPNCTSLDWDCRVSDR